MLNLPRKILACKSFIYIFLYFFVNIFILTHYPDIHSDEAWLSGLSRAWMNTGRLTVTEPFFDLMPRAPHAVKLLFHSLQSLFFAVSGYGVFQTRLISLLSACLSLFLFHKLLGRLLAAEGDAGFAVMVLLSIDPQFLAAAHMGRQEIQLIVLLLLSLLMLFPSRRITGALPGMLAGCMVIIAAGFHPAAFLIAAAAAGALPAAAIRNGGSLRSGIPSAAAFLASCAAGALIFAGISLAMNPDFLGDYLQFGESVEVTVPFYLKVIRFPHYYQKLWFRHSGTYFIPELRPLFIIHILSIVGTLSLSAASLFKSGQKRERFHLLLLPALMLFSFNAALLFLGKYAAPLFALQLPILYLALALTLTLTSKARNARLQKGVLAIVFLAAAATSLFNLAPFLQPGRERYSDYRYSIRLLLEDEQPRRLLANLNAEYALPCGTFLDYRNLAFLDEEGIDFEEYIVSRGITHILYSQELDVIYQRRPVWNILYGNVASYYEDMNRFIKQRCVPVDSFVSPVYGMRIIPYSGTGEWKITLYRVEDALSPP
jgi:hypothetical protein